MAYDLIWLSGLCFVSNDETQNGSISILAVAQTSCHAVDSKIQAYDSELARRESTESEISPLLRISLNSPQLRHFATLGPSF